MSTIRHDLALALPPALPPALPRLPGDSFLASAARGVQFLRRRWRCLGPDCAERGRLNWRPARIQLQTGWCCSPACFQAAFRTFAAEHLRQAAAPPAPHRHRVPLGLLLFSRGVITREQLREALSMQSSYGGGRIGDWLIRNGAADEEAISAGVALQWARPIFRLSQSNQWRQYRGWVPPAILESLRLLPLHFALPERRLYVGFPQAVDFHACASLATMFECKVEPCIITDSALNDAFEQLRILPSFEQVEDIGFDHIDDAAEISGIVRQYAQFLEARQVRIAVMGPFLWVRIRGEKIVHLTFRARPAVAALPPAPARLAASA